MTMLFGLKGGGFSHGGLVAAWSPTQLFTGGEYGFIFDISDISTLYQDHLQTTPVTADGDPVGFIQDLSGNGNHAKQSDATRRPLYKANGGKPYLQFDNVDDYLEFASGTLHFPDISVHIGTAQYDTASSALNVPHASIHVSPYFRWSIWILSSTKNESRFNGTPRRSAALTWWQNPTHFGFDTVVGEFYENGAVNSTFTPVTLTYPNTTTPRLGANASAGEISAMRFYGGVVINRGLTSAEVGKTGAWLQAMF